jgi:carbon storage regulator
MLNLTRRPNESIQISDEITVTVISIDGKKIRLGIKAPKHINVVRTELLDRDKKAQPQPPGTACIEGEYAITHYEENEQKKAKKQEPKITFKRRKIFTKPPET